MLHNGLQSPAGQEFNTALNDLLRRSSEDTLGDSRLELAEASMADDKMVKLQFTDDTTATIINADFVLGGDAEVLSILREILSYVLEALRLWSPVRVHEQSSAIKEVVGKIVQTQQTVDLCLGVLLHELCNDVFELIAKQGLEADEGHVVDLKHTIFQTMDEHDAINLLSENGAFSKQVE